jgi:hypothetical protein
MTLLRVHDTALLLAGQLTDPPLDPDLDATLALLRDDDGDINFTVDLDGSTSPEETVLASATALAIRLGLAETALGDGWADWEGTVNGIPVRLTAYFEDDRPAGPYRVRVRRHLRELAAAVRRDWTLDAILLAAAAVGAATALAARRAVR